MIVLVGEPGGNSEESAAQYIAETIDKPVIAYVAGHAPAGKMGSRRALAQVVGQLTLARYKAN